MCDNDECQGTASDPFEMFAIMNDFRENMSQLFLMFSPVVDSVKEFREALRRDGWSPQSADKMACDYFLTITDQIRKADDADDQKSDQ